SNASGPRPGHPRRSEAQGAARLSRDRPPQGPCRAARHHGGAQPPDLRAGAMTGRLSRARLGGLPAAVARPSYDPAAHAAGIVHIGVGAFHRAHQAVYTGAALAAAGGDWRITGGSLRSTGIADALNPQDGLYTL